MCDCVCSGVCDVCVIVCSGVCDGSLLSVHHRR